MKRNIFNLIIFLFLIFSCDKNNIDPVAVRLNNLAEKNLMHKNCQEALYFLEKAIDIQKIII